MCINSDAIGLEKTAELICNMVKLKEVELAKEKCYN